MLLLGKPCADNIVESFGDVSGVKLCTIGFDDDKWNQYANSLLHNAQKYGMQCENIVVGNCTPDEFCDIVKKAWNFFLNRTRKIIETYKNKRRLRIEKHKDNKLGHNKKCGKRAVYRGKSRVAGECEKCT